MRENIEIVKSKPYGDKTTYYAVDHGFNDAILIWTGDFDEQFKIKGIRIFENTFFGRLKANKEYQSR